MSKTSGFAIWSFFLGILSTLVFFIWLNNTIVGMAMNPIIKEILMDIMIGALLIVPFIAVILGIKALIDIKKRELKGESLAILGILLGSSTVFSYLFIIITWILIG